MVDINKAQRTLAAELDSILSLSEQLEVGRRGQPPPSRRQIGGEDERKPQSEQNRQDSDETSVVEGNDNNDSILSLTGLKKLLESASAGNESSQSSQSGGSGGEQEIENTTSSLATFAPEVTVGGGLVDGLSVVATNAPIPLADDPRVDAIKNSSNTTADDKRDKINTNNSSAADHEQMETSTTTQSIDDVSSTDEMDNDESLMNNDTHFLIASTNTEYPNVEMLETLGTNSSSLFKEVVDERQQSNQLLTAKTVIPPNIPREITVGPEEEPNTTTIPTGGHQAGSHEKSSSESPEETPGATRTVSTKEAASDSPLEVPIVGIESVTTVAAAVPERNPLTTTVASSFSGNSMDTTAEISVTTISPKFITGSINQAATVASTYLPKLLPADATLEQLLLQSESTNTAADDNDNNNSTTTASSPPQPEQEILLNKTTAAEESLLSHVETSTPYSSLRKEKKELSQPLVLKLVHPHNSESKPSDHDDPSTHLKLNIVRPLESTEDTSFPSKPSRPDPVPQKMQEPTMKQQKVKPTTMKQQPSVPSLSISNKAVGASGQEPSSSISADKPGPSENDMYDKNHQKETVDVSQKSPFEKSIPPPLPFSPTKKNEKDTKRTNEGLNDDNKGWAAAGEEEEEEDGPPITDLDEIKVWIESLRVMAQKLIKQTTQNQPEQEEVIMMGLLQTEIDRLNRIQKYREQHGPDGPDGRRDDNNNNGDNQEKEIQADIDGNILDADAERINRIRDILDQAMASPALADGTAGSNKQGKRRLLPTHLYDAIADGLRVQKIRRMLEDPVALIDVDELLPGAEDDRKPENLDDHLHEGNNNDNNKGEQQQSVISSTTTHHQSEENQEDTQKTPEHPSSSSDHHPKDQRRKNPWDLDNHQQQQQPKVQEPKEAGNIKPTKEHHQEKQKIPSTKPPPSSSSWGTRLDSIRGEWRRDSHDSHQQHHQERQSSPQEIKFTKKEKKLPLNDEDHHRQEEALQNLPQNQNPPSSSQPNPHENFIRHNGLEITTPSPTTPPPPPPPPPQQQHQLQQEATNHVINQPDLSSG